MVLTLKTYEREAGKSARAICRAGFVPVVYYGKHEPSKSVSISSVEFVKVWKKAGESSVVTLETPKGALDTLIYDVQQDPISGSVRHADFYVFEKGQKMKVKIPLTFSGVAPAVKDLGGVLVKVLHELEVLATPKDLPHEIVVPIARLTDFSSQILAGELELPKGVELVVKKEEVVASVYEPKEEVVPETPPDISSIEVEKKGKEKVPGAEGEEVQEPDAGKKTKTPTAEK